VAVRRPGLDANSPSGHSCRFLCALPQFAPVVIHTRNAKVRLPPEGLAQVSRNGPVTINFDDGKDEIFWLVECRENLILHNGDRARFFRTPLHFDKAQTPVC